MGSEEDFNVSNEDSYRISMEIEDLRSQLALKKKELKCYQENKKLRVELALKVKDVEGIRKENEELKAQNKNLQKNIVEMLDSQIESNKRHLQQSENWKARLELSNAQLEEEIKNLYEGNSEEMRNLQENEKLRLDLENKRRELNLRAKGLEKMSDENASDRKTLDEEKQKEEYDVSELELASIEQQRADADVLKLLADQEREKEDVLARMLQLEKELHEKQQLELEVERLNGTLQVMKHLEGDDDGGDIHEKMEKLSERFEREKKRLEDLSGHLVKKERESNDELQEARKELIKGLEEVLNGRTAIGIKRMGELDEKPFLNACKRKYGNDEYQMKAAELVTSWQDELKKPSWHPFKMVEVNGENEEILDDDDAKLKFLWIEYGDDVCNAVKTALMEINEYNPSGRYVVRELWNFRKGQKATVKEVLKYLFSKMDTTTKRRRG